MKQIFADTGYWIALIYPSDTLHSAAQSLHRSITAQNPRIITSEMVLTEFLNFFSGLGENLRLQAATFTMQIQQNPNVTVVPQSTEQFNQAVTFYMQRRDKRWSLTDCSSFLMMQALGITEALAHDRHFEQAGFRVLLKN
ncbi:PIN domain-containing protein [Kovacikia minuta CCNUW1]|uniref:type II toxin-antitoxin system VapC family toxin n=1 Tax=Kovacikia minuta TaxID=2931930 RepID=UPI001CCD4A25|nr:PIN domain-containing protein [Kovacikia minuta]UBF25269.1 PIN domain-containing protein [Kovacikia minuta CCNUW1]